MAAIDSDGAQSPCDRSKSNTAVFLFASACCTSCRRITLRKPREIGHLLPRRGVCLVPCRLNLAAC